ncbi:MAG TPA: histidine phosphatase family protein, partial [Candidatus Nitrosocosmicus sp.]|nr:histidine phosphatase family protein [Candidatus Nitrosocosmicus sp.]
MNTTFYIVRHGQTEWNVKGLLQGQNDSPLTENGIIQAKKLAKKLKDIHFDEVFSSDSLRAVKTAEILTLERQMNIKTAEAIRERRFGKFEGKTYEEFASELKHLLEKFNTLTDKEKLSFKYADDIESDEEIIYRFMIFIREIAVGYRGKTILLVTHGGIMRALLIHLGF